MTRKKKSLKREHSDIAPPAPPTSATSATSATAATAATAATSTSARSHPPNAPLPPTGSDHQHASKRQRTLTGGDHDRLGHPVHLDKWRQRIHEGRGAAVCLHATVAKIAHTTSPTGESLCHLDLHCHPLRDDDGDGDRHLTQPRLAATFHGSIAATVYRPIAALHSHSPPAHLYLSGFAASIPSAHPHRAEYRSAKAVIRLSSHSAAAADVTWIELLDGPPQLKKQQQHVADTLPLHPPHPPSLQQHQHRHTATALDSSEDTTSSSGANDSWFATPAPPAARPTASATSTLGSSLAAVPRPGGRREISHGGRAASSTAQRPSDSRKSRSPAQMDASNGDGPHRPSAVPPPTAPPRPRNDPVFQPVARIGNTEYTSLTALRNGQQANLAGVVIGAGDPRRAAGGSRDLNIKINLVDMSCSANLNRHNPGGLTSSLTLMLFSPTMDRIAHPVTKGQVLLFRRLLVQDFGGKTQAVGKKTEPWSWALYDPVTGVIRKSPAFDQVKPLTVAETDHMRRLATWYGELQGDELGPLSRPVRSTLQLSQISENLFFDSTVEVLKVYTHAHSPDLYVTDYTQHPLFYRGSDHYLNLGAGPLPYPDTDASRDQAEAGGGGGDDDGWGYVFQIGLWDIHADIAGALKTGDVIRIQNVRAKMNPLGMLVGGLGSAGDSGVKIKTLKPSDEARVRLEKRRKELVDGMQREGQAEGEGGGDDDDGDKKGAATATAEADAAAGGGPSIMPSLDGDAMLRPPKTEKEDDGERTTTATGNAAVDAAAAAAAAGTTTTGIDDVRTKEEEPDGTTIISLTKGASGSGVTLDASLPTPGQRAAHPPSARSPTLQPNTDDGSPSSSACDDVDAAPVTSTPRQPVIAPRSAPNVGTTIRCKAPSSIATTSLSSLLTTSTCPGMHKVQGRIISIRPDRVEEWARIECTTCRRLVPLEEMFCLACGEDGGKRYTMRFALLLEESQQEGGGGGAKRIPILFNDESATSFLKGIDAEKVHAGRKSCIATLKSKVDAILGEPATGRATVTLAIYSYVATEADGRKVRRFAALKGANVLV